MGDREPPEDREVLEGRVKGVDEVVVQGEFFQLCAE